MDEIANKIHIPISYDLFFKSWNIMNEKSVYWPTIERGIAYVVTVLTSNGNHDNLTVPF